MDLPDNTPPPDARSAPHNPAPEGLLTGAILACILAAVALLAAPLAVGSLPVQGLSSLAAAFLLTAAAFAAALLLAQKGGRTWPRAALAIGTGLLAATIILSAWWTTTVAPPGLASLFTGGAMLVLAFPVLVLERICAGLPSPLMAAPSALLRATLLVQIGLGLSLLLRGSGIPAAAPVIPACAAFVLLLAAEFLLRGIAALFLPQPDRAVAASWLAGWIRLRQPSAAALNQAITPQLGIDLSRSWALGFVTRALPLVAILLGLLAWSLTGLLALPLDQRAVYEQFGRPVAVLGPGLHLILPWPLGIARRVEWGVQHELTLAADTTRTDAIHSGASQSGAEDPPPQTADRLWDRAHPGETTYLIASPAASGQGFQRVDVDLRLITRIGLSDAAALQAAYAVADPDALVRAAAGRFLSRYFATRTLADVLVEDRQTFTDTVRTALQQDLDRLSMGIEIVAVIVEAIHPPPAAADAWHNVQSAEIRARIAVAEETGAAAKTQAAARTTADAATETATATAAEIVARAASDETLFAADHTAYAAQPEAFKLERWMSRLRATLPRANLLLLDHHLGGAAAPTLDLRNLAPVAATPP